MQVLIDMFGFAEDNDDSDNDSDEGNDIDLRY